MSTPKKSEMSPKPDDESTREQINLLTRSEGNDACADCGEINPQWASINFGVFICINCAGIHRSLAGPSASKVRSVRLDSWTPEMIQSIAEIGNKKARERYEAKVPPCWLPPRPKSRQVCLEQWIRAKYERKEFSMGTEEAQRSYVSGTRQGYLYKRKKEADEWRNRWFNLTHDYLSYKIAYLDKNPKNVIPLTHLNVTLQVPGMEDRNNLMLIAYHDHRAKKTRNIFVYAENGKEIMNWFCAIRMAKIKILQQTFPERPLDMISERASRDFTHHGYLLKTPSQRNRWQKRFFVLDQNSLRYYVRPADAHACGEIILGSSADGYYIDEEIPPQLPVGMFVFMLHVPTRGRGGFPLLAESEEDKQQWMAHLRRVILETTGSPDQSVAPSTYEDDDDLYASIGEVTGGLKTL